MKQKCLQEDDALKASAAEKKYQDASRSLRTKPLAIVKRCKLSSAILISFCPLNKYLRDTSAMCSSVANVLSMNCVYKHSSR